MSNVSSAAKWGAKPPDASAGAGGGGGGGGGGGSTANLTRLSLLANAASALPKSGADAAGPAGAGGSAVTATSTSGGATSTAYSYSTGAGVGSSTIGPLPTPKTITMTLVPDWNQYELKSMTRPISCCVVLGPANTLPQHAPWSFDFNLYAMDQLTGPSRKPDEEPIGKGQRCLLWYNGKPFGKYQHAVNVGGCRLGGNGGTDDIKTLSVVLRTYSEEKDPNALLYVRRKPGVPKHQSQGYCKVIQGHHYYLNITFAAGSTIAQLVGLHSWRPMVYLSVKKPEKMTNSEAITGSRLFTNFVTNWAQGVELNPDDRELKQASDALVADQREDDEAKLQTAASNKQERAAARSAPGSAGVLAGTAPPVVSFLLNDSAFSDVAGNATAVGAPTSAIGAVPLQQRAPSTVVPGLGTPGAPGGVGIAFPSSLTGAVSLNNQQTAQILAAQYQQQQQILLQQQQHALQLQRTMQLQQAAAAAAAGTTTVTTMAQRGPPLTMALPIATAALPGSIMQPALMGITVTGQQKTQAFQSALAPLTAGNTMSDTTGTGNFPRADIMSINDLEAEVKFKPLHAIQLPHLDSKSFIPEFSVEPTVERFYRPDESPVAPALCAIEGVARTVSLDSKHPANDASKHLLSALSAVNQLIGWQHVQNYITNPQLYVERLKSAQRSENGGDALVGIGAFSNAGGVGTSGVPTRGPVVPGSMDDFQNRGQLLIKKLCQRVEWLLDLQRRASGAAAAGTGGAAGVKPFDAEFAIKVIAADREWANEATLFMKEAETKVTDMLTKNQQKFQAFRELQRKGVQWPHSADLRREIEAAGFVFRPMMIKRDRCVCETCGVEVSGWRPWHNPWSFHNYSKHPSTFQPQVRNLLQPPTSAAVSQMVTEANRRKASNMAAAAQTETAAATPNAPIPSPQPVSAFSGASGPAPATAPATSPQPSTPAPATAPAAPTAGAGAGSGTGSTGTSAMGDC